ncbi:MULTISPECIES: SDR family NAD(P)-dependent oxidoreductase [Micromonospora]|uniref:Short-chain dehydrogenase n=1 Tax=Micromonospora sicca TaxID=2202420 RepID=A0A317DGD1_9ACTN|nr:MULTISPECIES: SDR family NAD(P)-dependent oxidoreductase [unclassified Micromonospora]MBM0229420.1 SDR family NAD(P)-dependent oxidoreductase [Micromonospora sp. ATA51]PWR13808.1 short-chain dehydrogenase [Micromonospora sp. 4G51]
MEPTIVITGATSGLGRLAAIKLAQQGTRIIITARSQQKAEQTCQEIGTDRVDAFLGDFTRLDDVRRIGHEIADRYDHIDVLVNNAGIHAFQPRTTPDGYPEMVAVNYLAPWLLTHTLLPALQRAPAARIVNVASEASRRHGTLRIPQDLTDTSPFGARGSSEHYGKTKLLDIMFTMELARRLAGTTITANCLDPGFNTTGLGRELRFAGILRKVLTRLRIGDPARGTGLIVALATDSRFTGRTGGYYTVRGTRQIQPTPPGNDPSAQAQLWYETQQLLEPVPR